MAKASPPLSVIVRKAFPALVLALLILISLMFLISYTDAFYLVILLWIVVPVMLVKAFRRIRDRFRTD